jgi:RNA polymerase sigma factor (sigma-70 family)
LSDGRSSFINGFGNSAASGSLTTKDRAMRETSTFDSFMERIRGGSEDAARELVDRFEGVIRREARLRMDDHRLLRVFDSMDISQSVLTSFFVRASTGHFDLETPEQLVKLLLQMTRNKLAFQVRRHRARRRDNRLLAAARVDELNVASTYPGPSQIAADHDLIDAVRLRLDDEERQIADLRAEGWEWSEIASRLGGSAQARRMQLSRAVNRVAKALKLDRDTDV